MSKNSNEQSKRQSEVVPEDSVADVEATENDGLHHRRDFLTKSAVVLAVLGATGLLGIDSAQAQRKRYRMTGAQGRALQDVMDQALADGDIKAALSQKGRGLPKEVSSILSQLTSDDLRAAASLGQKLRGLRDIAADNNGGIGM